MGEEGWRRHRPHLPVITADLQLVWQSYWRCGTKQRSNQPIYFKGIWRPGEWVMRESTFLTKWPDFAYVHSYPLLLCSHFNFIVTIAFSMFCCDALMLFWNWGGNDSGVLWKYELVSFYPVLDSFPGCSVQNNRGKSNALINNFSKLAIYTTQVVFSEAVTIPGEIIRQLVSCSAKTRSK